METTRHYQHILPADVLLNVFGYLDARELVFNCRRVCKFWKRTVESSDMWKLQIRRLTVSNKEIGSILPSAHSVYPWYMCYALCKNIFGTNLILGSAAKTRATSSVLDFAGKMVYYSRIGAYTLGFSLPPQELLDEGANFCIFAAVGYCSVKYTIDLYARGFTKKIFELNPPIVIYVWFTLRHDFTSVHNLKVTLLNSRREVDDENGIYQHKMRTNRMVWHNVMYAFTDYSSDVRYVTFENAIDITFPRSMELYRKYLLLELGAKVTAAKIVVNLPDLTPM